MAVTTPATTERLVSAFRARLETPDNRWVELRSLLLTDLRTERDAVYELGRLNVQYVVRCIDDIASAASGLDLLTANPVTSVDPAEVSRISTLVRRMTSVTLPEVLNGSERSTRSLSSALLSSGEAQENFDLGLAAARLIASTWRSLVEATEGFKDFYSALEALPAVDMGYFGTKLADWTLDASWQNDPTKRKEMIDSVLSALVYMRLRQRAIVPPLTLPNQLGAAQGVCEPATVVGRNSGPFRVTGGCREVAYETETTSATAQAIPLPELVINFPFAYSDGYYYFYGLQPGTYDVVIAANVLPGVSVKVTTIHSFSGSRIKASNLRDIVNSAGIPGILASVGTTPQQLPYVKITCSDPVTGPRGWVMFYGFSDPKLASCFPSGVQKPTNHRTAVQLASELNASAAGAAFTGDEYVLMSGKWAWPSYPSFNCVAIMKVWDSCSLAGTEIIPDNTMLDTIEVGDECLLPPSTVCNVVEVKSDRFVVDVDLGVGQSAFSIAPKLVRKVDGVNYALFIGGRWYRFRDSDWSISSGIRYVNLGNYGHWGTTFEATDFSVIQQPETVESLDTSAASRMKVDPGLNDILAGTEIWFSGTEAYARAYEWGCDSTEKDGFRSRLRAGDFVVSNKINFPLYIDEVHDGYIRLSVPVNVSQGISSPVFYNAVRYEWDKLESTFSLPTFNIDSYEKAIERASRKREGQTINQLITAGQQLAADLASPKALAEAFVDLPFQVTGIQAILRSIRRIGLSRFYKELQLANFSGLSGETRQTTDTGVTAEEATTLAREFIMRLSPIERLTIGMDD